MNAILTIKLIKTGHVHKIYWIEITTFLTIKLIKKKSQARNLLDRIFPKDGIQMPFLTIKLIKKGHVHKIYWIEITTFLTIKLIKKCHRHKIYWAGITRKFFRKKSDNAF